MLLLQYNCVLPTISHTFLACLFQLNNKQFLVKYLTAYVRYLQLYQQKIHCRKEKRVFYFNVRTIRVRVLMFIKFIFKIVRRFTSMKLYCWGFYIYARLQAHTRTPLYWREKMKKLNITLTGHNNNNNKRSISLCGPDHGHETT